MNYSMGYSELFNLVGLIGVLFYLGSYSALQMGRIDGNSLSYSALNGIAAVLVLISLYKHFNLASALIQIVWITLSIAGACRHLVSKNKAKNAAKNPLGEQQPAAGWIKFDRTNTN